MALEGEQPHTDLWTPENKIGERHELLRENFF